MNVKLIFLDIDGTLTPPGSNIPPRSALDAIDAARANGHKVFLCSGRNIPMLKPLMNICTFDGAVGGAGGIVFVGDRVLYDCPMEREDFETAMKLLEQTHVFRTIESKEGTWCDEGMGAFLAGKNGGNSELIRLRRALEEDLGVRPLNEYPGCPVYKIVFTCESEEQLAPAKRALGEKYNFVVQEAFSLGCLNGEMINRKFDKGKGVRLVTEYLGCDLADTIGFGDSMNDLEMIETVGASVCMENGSPTLKAKSSLICPPVDRDGIATAFQQLNLI